MQGRNHVNERATYLCFDLFKLLAFRLLYILICFQGTSIRLFSFGMLF